MNKRRGSDGVGDPGAHRMLSSKPSRRGSQSELLIVDNEQGTPTRELLADLMEKVGVGWYQICVLPSLLGITVVECGQIQVISGIAVGLKFEWGLTPGEKALLPTLAFCGLAIGTVVSGIASDAFGRKKTIFSGYIATAITGMSLSLATNFTTMACFIFINGIACGLGVASAMVMIAEICPSSIRAAALVLPLLAQSAGEIFAVGMVDVFMPDLVHGNWRAVTLCVALPSYVLLVLSCLVLRESPYWLVSNGRVFEARTEILKIAEMNGTLDKVKFFAATLDTERDTASGSSTDAIKNDDMSTVLGKCFSSLEFVIMTFGFCLLCFVGQLLTFGMSYFWPYMLQFSASNSSYFAPATSLGLIRSFGIPSALFMIPIMGSNLGHRWVIFFAGIFEASILYGCLTFINYNNGTQIVLLAGMSLAFAQLFYYTSSIFMAESFPTTIRAFMCSVCLTNGRVGALVAPHLIERLGFHGFLALAVGLTLTAAPLVGTMRETKGKQLEDFFDEDADTVRDRRPGNRRAPVALTEHTPLLEQSSSAEESGLSGCESHGSAGGFGDTGGSGYCKQ